MSEIVGYIIPIPHFVIGASAAGQWTGHLIYGHCTQHLRGAGPHTAPGPTFEGAGPHTAPGTALEGAGPLTALGLVRTEQELSHTNNYYGTRYIFRRFNYLEISCKRTSY